jgi:hypothetical protein
VNDDSDSISSIDVLPDSRPKHLKRVFGPGGTVYVKIFCANCGADGGGVPEEHMTFAFVLCNACTEKFGTVANTYSEPDTVFWERVKQAQLEEHGRLLNGNEIVKILDDVNSPLSKLVKEAPKGR